MKSEVRSPKSESPGPETAEDRRSWEFFAFWLWGEENSGEMVLREDPPRAATEPPDLEERAARFGEAVVRFARRIPRGPATDRLTDQLVGAGTSLGANYCEARDAVSRKDFRNRVGISRKESKETMFFLRMLAAAEPSLATEARRLWREARELNRIFGAIWRK
jgi:four helix bundle protein